MNLALSFFATINHQHGDRKRVYDSTEFEIERDMSFLMYPHTTLPVELYIINRCLVGLPRPARKIFSSLIVHHFSHWHIRFPYLRPSEVTAER